MPMESLSASAFLSVTPAFAGVTGQEEDVCIP